MDVRRVTTGVRDGSRASLSARVVQREGGGEWRTAL